MRILIKLCVITSLIFSQAVFAKNLIDEKEGFQTKIVKKQQEDNTFPIAPNNEVSIVKYETKLGLMSAYISNHEPSKKKYPAIIWLTGGFPSGGSGESQWEERPVDNDQSAKNYRLNGVVTLIPSFRGSFSNPGYQENFLGEVDDVLASLEYLLTLDHVDPKHIYLGGHSTGGTLALLVAASTDKFKGVFAFGPVDDPAGYGFSAQLHDTSNPKEAYFRAPINFLQYIKSKTFIIEGASGGNADSVEMMQAKNTKIKNKKLNFAVIDGADHFSVLYPLNELISKKVQRKSISSITPRALQTAFDDFADDQLKAQDLEILDQMKAKKIPMNVKTLFMYTLLSSNPSDLQAATKAVQSEGLLATEIEPYGEYDGVKYYALYVGVHLEPKRKADVFKTSKKVNAISNAHDLIYQGWVFE